MCLSEILSLSREVAASSVLCFWSQSEPNRPPRGVNRSGRRLQTPKVNENKGEGNSREALGKLMSCFQQAGRLQSQVAENARQVKEIIFITQLPGPSLSKDFLQIRTTQKRNESQNKSLKQHQMHNISPSLTSFFKKEVNKNNKERARLAPFSTSLHYGGKKP